MATYNMTLDKNMTTQFYADDIIRIAVGDKNGTVLNVTLGDGYQSTDITGNEIELRATAPDGQSVIQSSAVTMTDAKKGKFTIKLPQNITKKSGDIADARFRLTKGDVIESTSLFKIRILHTPGMVEVNGDIIDRLDEILQQSMASLNDLKKSVANADGELANKLTELQTTLDKTISTEQAKVTKVIKDWTEDYQKIVDNFDKASKAKLDGVDTAYNAKVKTWQTNFNNKIAEWQSEVNALNLAPLKAEITALQNKLDTIKTDIASIDLPAMKQAVDKAVQDVANMKTTVDKKADKDKVYTKDEVDEAIKKGGKVKTATINGGAIINPDDNGNLPLVVPNPDLSSYATQTYTQNLITSKIADLQKFVALSQSQYNALSTKDPKTVYLITEG